MPFMLENELSISGSVEAAYVALTWRESIYKPGTVKILPCELRDLQQSWEYFRHADLYKLSAVDATSFAIMKRARIRLAYTFDHHFAAVGFRFVG